MSCVPPRSVALALLVPIVITACGGAPEAKAPATRAEGEPEPTTIEEAQDQIWRARERLSAAASGAPAADASRPAEEAPLKEPGVQSTRPEAASKPSANEAVSRVDDRRCSSPCRALASMRRAVTALCRMTGDTDNRCIDAKRTLADSEGRISPCSC